MSSRRRRHAHRILIVSAMTVVVFLVSPGAVSAHRERPVGFPDGTGSVPEYRSDGPYLVVCANETPALVANLPKELRKVNQRLYAECRRSGFRHLQAAVDAVEVPGTRILVQPGTYTESPSLRPPSAECAALADKPMLSYEEHVTCPHAQNLVAILGDGPDADSRCDARLCDLQIEGTGARPEDVVFDARFQRHVAIRADRADGIYIRNFTVQHAPDYGIYVIETDGFVIDRMLGRWNDRYAFLTFAGDHGLYVGCEAYGNGDSGLYPGAASPQNGARHSIEIRHCRSHHNFAGLAGTAGNSLWVHDNDFYDNTVGIGLDSLFPNHPGMPQSHSRFTGNRIYSNNQDFYRFYRDGTCFKPSAERGYEEGVVCPSGVGPVGTGIVVAGGNANEFRDNRIWDNARFGVMQFWVPAALRGENDPAMHLDTSHHNRYIGNHFAANGTDVWWDEEGAGNCWQDNVPAGGVVTSDPVVLPDCTPPPAFTPPHQVKTQSLLACMAWRKTNVDPTGCAWTRPPRQP
jgi:hypothetical protein